MKFKPVRAARQRGDSMIEILVTLVILSVGLLGLAGLQYRLHGSEIEAYQRSQAVVLLGDMVNRLSTNRLGALNYVTGSGQPVGAGMSCPVVTNTSSQAQIDLAAWCQSLQGAAEVAAGASVGAMIGGRGCIEDLGAGEYRISVAWQGTTPLNAPDAALACGAGSYDGAAGEPCTGDRCRRIVSTTVRIANLN